MQLFDQYYKEDKINKHLYQIPPKNNRYIVLDTETTGLHFNEGDHIVEIGAVEIKNGNLTGGQFHIYIRPRKEMEERVIKIHGIKNNFYDEYYKDIYQNDKTNLINFKNWIGDSKIFAHNAPFDMRALNHELNYWKIPEINNLKFRCSMRIFREVVGKKEPNYDEKYTKLSVCCDYFGLESNKSEFHNALFDAYMTGRLICELYKKIDSDSELFDYFKYNENNYIDTHYKKYIMQKVNNHFDINFYNNFCPPSHHLNKINLIHENKTESTSITTIFEENDKKQEQNDKINEEKQSKDNDSELPPDVINQLLNEFS